MQTVARVVLGIRGKIAPKPAATTSIVGSEKSPFQILFPLPDLSDRLINRKLLVSSRS